MVRMMPPVRKLAIKSVTEAPDGQGSLPSHTQVSTHRSCNEIDSMLSILIQVLYQVGQKWCQKTNFYNTDKSYIGCTEHRAWE